VSQMEVTSALKIKNICVFGGSSPEKEKEFLESANHLGRVLVERKIHLVYGGGSLGLMGSVSIAVFLGVSQVLRVVPKALAEGDIIGKTIGEELLVDQLQSFIPVIDPSMSRLNWSIIEYRKKLRLDLSLRL